MRTHLEYLFNNFLAILPAFSWQEQKCKKIETIIAINQIFFGKNFYTKAKLNCTSILDVYALTCLQNKPKNLHESISFRYHLYPDMLNEM